MHNSDFSVFQLVPPVSVFILLAVACYFFYTRYVSASKNLITTIRHIGSALRSMSEGEEIIRKAGVTRVFKGTILEKTWYDFSKTLHPQADLYNRSTTLLKHRITVPASYFFSVSNVIDQTLRVDYFKHLPGILTGIGIIGTFSGLLFGLSSFDASSPELMTQSVGALLSGVREAFYASAAAIAVAMLITHAEKILYQRCLSALDNLVDSINTLFEAGVGEEYLAIVAQQAMQGGQQNNDIRREIAQALSLSTKQIGAIQSELSAEFSDAVNVAISNACRQLGNQIENALLRQVKTPLEALTEQLNENTMRKPTDPKALARKVIRARLGDGVPDQSSEVI